MAINEIVGQGLPIDPLKGREVKGEKRSKTTGKDKAELSEEARALYEAKQEKRAQEIQTKIEQGFYFQPEVTEKVVEMLLKDLKNQAR